MGNFILQTTFDREYQELLLSVEEYCLCFSEDDYSNCNLIKSLYFEFDADKLKICKPKSQTDELVESIKVLTLQYFFQMPLVFKNDEMEESSVQQLYSQYITADLPPETVNGGLHIIVYVNPYNNCNASNLSKLIKAIPNNLNDAVTVDVILMPVIFDHDISSKEKEILKSNLKSLIDLKTEFSEVLRNIFYSESIDARGAAHVIDFQKLVSVFGRLLLAHINGYGVFQNENNDYPITTFGITSVQIDKFDIINNWCQDFLKNLISPFIEKNDEPYTIDYSKIQSVLAQILDEEKQLISQVSNDKDIEKELSKQYKNRILEIVLQNNLNPKERKFLLDCCLDLCNRDVDSIDMVDITDIPLPDELFIEQLKELNGDNQYDALRRVIAQIHSLKKIINDREQQINEIKNLLDENYPFDGELKDEGFLIHGQLYKPYSFHEEPLESDYSPKCITTEPSADLRRHFGEIKSQGKQGACASFSLVSVFEYFLANETAPLDLSEAFVYYNAREKTGDTDKDDGTTLQNIIKAMTDHGVCVEELCPYDETKYNERPNEEAYQDGLKRKVNAAKNVPVNIDIIKSAIIDGYPVVASFRVFDSLAKNVGGFVPLPTDRERANSKKEYHAMVICGYSDQEGYFIVRNSWGTQFGDKGYCYMPYAYVRDPELTTYACAITGVDVNAIKHIADRFKYNLEDKDNNIQFAVLNNQLLEEQRRLVSNKEELKILYEKYVELLKSIRSGECMTEIRRSVDEKIAKKNRLREALKEEKKQYSKPLCSQTLRIVWIIMMVLSAGSTGAGIYLHYYNGYDWTMSIIGGAILLLCLILGGVFAIKTVKNRKKQKRIQEQMDILTREISELESIYQKKSNLQNLIAQILKGLDTVADNSKKRKKLLLEIEGMLADVYSWIKEELGDEEVSPIEYSDVYQSIIERIKDKWHILNSLFVDGFDFGKIKEIFNSIQREILQYLNDEFNIQIEDYYGKETEGWRAFRREISNTTLLSQIEMTGSEPGTAVFFSNCGDADILGCSPVQVNNNQYLYMLLRWVNLDNIKVLDDNIRNC